MGAATSLERSTGSEDFRRRSAAIRLWDVSPLDRLVTPWHDLARRTRPFPVSRNFFHTAELAASARWVEETLALERGEYERLLREDVGGFVSWVYPDAAPRQLRALADFHHWAVWLDDQMDRKTTPASSLSACSVLETLGTAELAPFDDFFTRMRAGGMDDRHAARFLDAMHRYGASSRTEVRAREGQGRFGSVAEYIANRRESAAMPVYYTLIAWISRIDLPDEVYAHPVVVDLENACSDYALLYNDAGSFTKEYLAGRTEGTFVRLLSRELGLSVQDTLYEIADMAAAAADDLETASDRIDACGLPTEQCAQIHVYAEGLRKFTGGVNHWSNHTPRYLVGQPLAETPSTSRAGDTHHLRIGPA
ncbi:terpene synthase family protein [Streptomyces virginiae]|uniref:terpene synthase family protein n=1 Tax=Streptomyces virginiae TaxID=1961 RepID=UPI003803FAD6